MKHGQIRVLDESEIQHVRTIRKSGFNKTQSLIMVTLAVNGQTSIKDLIAMTGSYESIVNISLHQLEDQSIVKLDKKTGDRGRPALMASLNENLADLVRDHFQSHPEVLAGQIAKAGAL